MPRKPAKPACKHCEFWAKPEAERGTEEFIYCFGLASYDIDAARKIIEASPREVWEVPTDRLAGFIDYPEGSNSWGTHIEEGHLDHVNMEVPVILGFTLRQRAKDETPRKLFPIDGSHRIARSVRDKLPVIKCYRLTEEETDKILTDRRPPRRKPPKRKK